MGLAYLAGVSWKNVFVNYFVSSTDPALDVGNNVSAFKKWLQVDDDTAPTAVLGVFIRNADNTAWLPASGGAGGGGGGGGGGGTGETPSLTYLVSGGSIAWTEDLDFLVGPTNVVLAGDPVSCAGGTVSLDPADPTDDRIDIIVIDATGALDVLTGTPAPTPVAPAVDPALYYAFPEIRVEAGATSPAGVVTEVVYEEDAGTGGGEWATSQSGGTIAPGSTSGPLVGTKSVLGTAVASGHYVELTETAPVAIETYDRLLFLFRATAAWPTKRVFRISVREGATFRGQNVVVKHGVYGMNALDTAAAYLVSVPIASFAVPAGLAFDRIRIEVAGSGSTVGFKLDSIWLQTGVGGAVGGSGMPTGGAAGTALFKQSGTDFDAIFRAITQADVAGLVAALALLAPKAAPPLTGAATLDGAAIATQPYVDSKVAGLSWKQAVRVATAAAGTLASSFENGDTVDGVVLATGDRILIKNQAAGAENGIYTVNASGAPTRATDADTAADIRQASVYVEEGTTNADTQWTLSTNAPITLGSTALVFTQLATGGAPTGAAGGSLGGTYPNPTVTKLNETGGPTALTLGAIADGEELRRVGSTVVGSAIPLPAPVKTETASYTLVLTDAGKWVRMNNASPLNLTVPLNSSVAYPTGTEIHVEQRGAGQVTVVATGGVTIRTPETLKLAKQYAVATLKKVDTDEWVLAGYLEV